MAAIFVSARGLGCMHHTHVANTSRRLPIAQCSTSSGEQQDSSDFASALRKGFQPQRKQPAAAGNPLPAKLGNSVVLGNDMSEATWREMDKKLNKYPGYRTFTAIGTGGEDFKASMVKAVEQVVGPVHVECVSQRPSSKGQYLSVKVGPVVVLNPDQVIQVFAAMRKDERLKWYM